jgi:hypothetical protein
MKNIKEILIVSTTLAVLFFIKSNMLKLSVILILLLVVLIEKFYNRNKNVNFIKKNSAILFVVFILLLGITMLIDIKYF